MIQRLIVLKGRKIALATISTMLYFAVLICYLRLAKGSEFAYGIVHLAGVAMSFSLAFWVAKKRLETDFI